VSRFFFPPSDSGELMIAVIIPKSEVPSGRSVCCVALCR
jgi:hypothetical protein